MDIILASGNKGKLKEVINIFSNSNINILSLFDLDFTDEIEETGSTFKANAFIKAETLFDRYKIPTIADDSGLVVNQLGGRPGVYSARYAGANATYLDNNLKLLSELKIFCEPHFAKFVCCAVYFDGINRISVQGELKGKIISEFKGTNGFGFDPIFQPENFEITLAEMNITEKNKISHRAKAFNELYKRIKEFITSQQ